MQKAQKKANVVLDVRHRDGTHTHSQDGQILIVMNHHQLEKYGVIDWVASFNQWIERWKN